MKCAKNRKKQSRINYFYKKLMEYKRNHENGDKLAVIGWNVTKKQLESEGFKIINEEIENRRRD